MNNLTFWIVPIFYLYISSTIFNIFVESPISIPTRRFFQSGFIDFWMFLVILGKQCHNLAFPQMQRILQQWCVHRLLNCE